MLSVAILYVIIFVFNFYSSFVLSNDLICQWVETTGYLHDLSGVFVISVRTHLLRFFSKEAAEYIRIISMEKRRIKLTVIEDTGR